MKLRKTVAVLSLAGLFLAVPSLFAQRAAERPIAAVDVSGNRLVAPDTIRFYLDIVPGAVYDEAKLQERFLRLWATGLFEDIKISKEDTAQGVRVLVAVKEKPVIKSIEFSGNKAVPSSQIKTELANRKIEIRPDLPVDAAIITSVQRVLKDYYAAQGYRFAEVSYKIEELPAAGGRKLVFLIDEGGKVRIDDIEFAGNEVFSDTRLKFAMRKTKERSLISWIGKKDVFAQENFDEDLDRVRDLYMNAGYKDVTLGEPRLVATTLNPAETREKKRKRRLSISIPIEEGERYYVGKIEVTGNTVLDGPEILRHFRYREGQVLRKSLITNGIEEVQEIYRNRGYIYIHVAPEINDREGTGNLVDVSLRVSENEPYHLGRLEFLGNTTTRDKVLRREVKLSEGDVMAMGQFRKSLFKINQLGYFKLNDNPVFDVDNENKRVNITVKGEEAAKNDFQIGGGYSELDGLFGQVSFQTRNFMGRGEILGIYLQSGKRRDTYDLSYTDPWFLDRRQALGITLFNRSVDYLDFTQASQGVSFAYGYGVGDFSNLGLFYNYEVIEVKGGPDDPGANPDPYLQNFDGETSSLTPSFRYDSRDDPFDPRVGTRMSLNMEYAGGILGGQVGFYKPQLQLSRYQPLTKRTVLAANLEMGYVFPVGDRDVPYFERFYLGGEQSIRGFKSRSISPRDELNRRIGGDKFLQFNFEYLFSVGGPLKLVAFFDAGQSYSEDQSLDLGRLRYSAGAEMRLLIPMFQAPLRFIYGMNLDPEPDEARTDFQFTIGTSF